jgi:hypothetical protein
MRSVTFKPTLINIKMKKQENLNMLVNSSVLLCMAAVLQMSLHEFGHFIAAIFYNVKPILFHNSVNYNEKAVGTLANIFIAAAGPVISLLIGLIFQSLASPKIKNVVVRLFLAYMSAFGYIGFFGYLMVAPFFTYGDTGFVLNSIGSPQWLIIVLAISAVPCLFFLMRSLARPIISVMSNETANVPASRGKFIRLLILYPLFIGIGGYTLLNLPVPTVLSLIAPLASPWTLVWVYGDYLKKEPGRFGFDPDERIKSKVYVWIIIGFILAIALNRILSLGVSF